MAENKDIREREKIAKEIEKTTESIRKKHRALKTGKIEEDIATKSHFKPIIEPLQKIVDNSSRHAIKDEPHDDDIETSFTQKDAIRRNMKRNQKDISVDHALSGSRKLMRYMLNDATDSPPVQHTSNDAMDSPAITSTPRTTIGAAKSTNEALEDVFETTDDSFGTSVQHQMQTLEGRKALLQHFGSLGQKYIGDFLSGSEKEKIIDTVYGVRLNKDRRMMLGDKKFDVDSSDNIIIDGVRYAGTPGLYELIFKRIPDGDIYTDDDLQKYKSILLATNIHRRNYTEQSRLRSNRGYKYKHVIAPLMSIESAPKRTNKSGKGLPSAMILNDNAIDYVHWDDPNELVDRLRLLDASHRAGNNAHDNEILSIIEELREAGLIIN